MSDTTSTLEGGEVGSGHSMLAIFEVKPTAHNREAAASGLLNEYLATADIHYRLPERKELRYFHQSCPYNYLEFREMEHSLRFSTSVAVFGQMLHMSQHVRNVTWEQELALVRETMDPLDPLHKEFLDLVTRAQKIYGPLKKRKRWGEEDY
jgi:Ca-activated chloride channel family protein